MTTPDERVYNGARAREVLENTEFIAAFDAIEKEVIDTWTSSPARDAEGRERLWTYLHLLRKVRTQLMSTMETGKLAQLDINHRRSTAEKLRSMLSL